MDLKRFGLGICFDVPSDRDAAGYAVEAAELVRRALADGDVGGLTLWRGVFDEAALVVIMGGKLGRMRRIHALLRSNGELMALVRDDTPFIENNRLARIEGVIQAGTL